MTRSASVLLVDDDDVLREMMRVALSRHESFEVVGDARNGEDALVLVDQVHPDIVVLDLSLPGIAGRDVLTRLRATNPYIRVVVYSGAESEGARSALDLGAHEVVAKSDHLSGLLTVLEDLVANSLDVATLDLEHDASSVRRARRFTEQQMGDWDLANLVENAVLIVSELVTNAITHGESRCRVVLRRGIGSIRVEVADHGAGSPEPQPHSTVSPGGRGLMIVATLATAWGIAPSPYGKMVWAELAA